MLTDEDQVDIIASLLLARAEFCAIRDLCVEMALEMKLHPNRQHPEEWLRKTLQHNVEKFLRTTEDNDAALAAKLREKLDSPL